MASVHAKLAERILDMSDICLTESTRGVRHFVRTSDISFLYKIQQISAIPIYQSRYERNPRPIQDER